MALGWGALGALAALGAACEETLEACAPCGAVSGGATNISGDPRLDGLLEAVGRHSAWGSRAEADFDASVDALAHAAGYAHDEGDDGILHATPEQLASVVSIVRAALFTQTGVETATELAMPRCAVDAKLALARQKVCERAAGCYVDSACDFALGSCAGQCAGSCTAERPDGGLSDCGGGCYVDADGAGGACLDECIGACALADAGPCAGRCRGACASTCSAHASDGACDGACAGACAGLCITASPAACAGECLGSCRVPFDPASGCAGTCRGGCAAGACDGACLGQFRPEGCDLPSRCDGVLACQETGKDLAWAYLRCAPGAARVHAEVGAGFTGDEARLVRIAAAYEATLSLVLRDYGPLSLLVDGVDPSGEVAAADMVEGIDTDARPYAVREHGALVEAGVPDDRAGLPLSALRARVSAVSGEISGGGYTIAAGPMPCVEPAFEEALALLDALVPIAARDTSGADPAGWPEPVVDRTRGLYRVLDGATALLGAGAEE